MMNTTVGNVNNHRNMVFFLLGSYNKCRNRVIKVYFEYNQFQLDELRNKDPKLKEVIDEMGFIQREVIPDLFVALINSIVGQQIAAKAADTVWKRMLDKFKDITPEILNEAKLEEIQACGMSFRKAQYIKNAASKVYNNELDLTALNDLSDKEVIQTLIQFDGIGEWTAEMLMIFSMNRYNILSYKDLAIQRGLMNLYHHRKITKKLFAKYQRRFDPYNSIASLYLWQLSHKD